MNWFTPLQALGYLGTACLASSAFLVAKHQRTCAMQWLLTASGCTAWLIYGFISGNGAIVLDGFVFGPVHAWGAWRYFRKDRQDE